MRLFMLWTSHYMQAKHMHKNDKVIKINALVFCKCVEIVMTNDILRDLCRKEAQTPHYLEGVLEGQVNELVIYAFL